jgi:hypothetical protein
MDKKIKTSIEHCSETKLGSTTDYATIQNTIYHLRNLHRFFSNPDRWHQGDDESAPALRLDEAFQFVGVDVFAHQQNCTEGNEYPGNLERGQIAEPVWFVRQAVNNVAPEFGGLIYKWNDAPGRIYEDVMNLITSALDLAKTELSQILASDDGFDVVGLALHRWAEQDGSQLCAMSALSQKLGHGHLTDIPAEVDPGLAALVNLLNDRASDETRQQLVSRLKFIPNTGRTKLCILISEGLFPRMIWDCGEFKEEVSIIMNCENEMALAEAYERTSRRFLKRDGSGNVAIGCSTISAALKAKDPIQQDLLAVSAASQLVGFEEEHGWTELLQVLDVILGLDDSPYIESKQSRTSSSWLIFEDKPSEETPEVPRQTTSDEEDLLEEIYDFGVKIRWFPALVEKFPDQLEDVAKKILSEISSLGSDTIYMHQFPFAGSNVMIATSWDDNLDVLVADADLVTYQDAVGEIEVEGDALLLLRPVAASDGGSLH